MKVPQTLCPKAASLVLKRFWAQVESRVGRCLLLWAPSSLGSFGGTALKTRRHLKTRRSTVLPAPPPYS